MELTTDNLAAALDAALLRFQDARAGARKFHAGALGAGVDPRRCLGDFLARVQKNDAAGLEKVYGSTRTKAALAENSGTAGGYLVPQEIRYELMASVVERSFVRPFALVVPMTESTLDLPLPDLTTAQALGVPPSFGGFSPSWSAEATAAAESEPAFKDVNLRANDLEAYFASSNAMKDDGGAPLEEYLKRLVAMAFSWFEDYAFLQGDGVSKPMGALKSNAALTVNRVNANKISAADPAAMLGKLTPASYSTALWFVQASAVVQLTQLLDTGSRPTWIPNDPGKTDPPGAIGNLYGRPVYVTEKTPALGTKGDLILFDPALYVIGDRRALEIAASPHPNFLKGQTVWLCTERVDGRPWVDRSITLQDTSTAVSPVVLLN